MMLYEQPRLQKLFDFTARYWKSLRFAAIPVITFLIFAVYGLVYATGGIKYVFSHSMYLVILIAGFVFGVRGGIAVGLIAGLILGPFMPINVETGEQQSTLNWIYRTGFFVLAGALAGLFSDSIRHYIRHIQWVSRHDTQTGLPNRVALIDELKKIQERDAGYVDSSLSIVSLDNLPEIEKAFGPQVTDQVAFVLSTRLGSLKLKNSKWFRSHLNQFALLALHAKEVDIKPVHSRLIDDCSKALKLDASSIHADIRIGYTQIERLTESPDLIVRKAELAARFASESSRQYAKFKAEMAPSMTQESLELLGELKEALGRQQLRLHYQPKVELSTGRIKGVEALMRWQHPVKGDIPPGKFIPRAEQSTLIEPLTDWALDKALKQVSCWHAQGINVAVAVNISAQNLLQENFSKKVFEALERYDVEASFLELEVTESAFMQDKEQCIKQLNCLADSGIVISIDDFGTGFSSLQYLHDLPVSIIKIDRKFIEVLERTGSKTIASSAIFMAHKLGMAAIAEGVEQLHSCEKLAELGCDLVQGFLLSKPLPASEFEQWYRSMDGVYALPFVSQKPYLVKK